MGSLGGDEPPGNWRQEATLERTRATANRYPMSLGIFKVQMRGRHPSTSRSGVLFLFTFLLLFRPFPNPCCVWVGLRLYKKAFKAW